MANRDCHSRILVKASYRPSLQPQASRFPQRRWEHCLQYSRRPHVSSPHTSCLSAQPFSAWTTHSPRRLCWLPCCARNRAPDVLA
jgi:hypothetical protein